MSPGRDNHCAGISSCAHAQQTQRQQDQGPVKVPFQFSNSEHWTLFFEENPTDFTIRVVTVLRWVCVMSDKNEALAETPGSESLPASS